MVNQKELPLLKKIYDIIKWIIPKIKNSFITQNIAVVLLHITK